MTGAIAAKKTMMAIDRRIAATILATVIAIPAEGLRRWAYNDTGSILTVCQGHTGPDVVKGKKYSLAECDAFMTDDMREAVRIVDTCVPGLPVNVLAAFSDSVFNMGPTIACNTKKSTAARLLKAGRIEDACRELSKWSKARVAGIMVTLPGLVKRRSKELELCLLKTDNAN